MRESHPCAHMQSVYSGAPTDWATYLCIVREKIYTYFIQIWFPEDHCITGNLRGPIDRNITFLDFINFYSIDFLIDSIMYIYICIRGAYDKFPDIFRMGTFIGSIRMKI